MRSGGILFVDDEPDILELGVSVLRSAGYEAQTAINGDIALILIEQGLPFHLLITDIIMPGFLDGFALARAALQLLPDLRILYTTGFAGVPDLRSRNAPQGTVLRKPWVPSEFLNQVGELVAQPVTGFAPRS